MNDFLRSEIRRRDILLEGAALDNASRAGYLWRLVCDSHNFISLDYLSRIADSGGAVLPRKKSLETGPSPGGSIQRSTLNHCAECSATVKRNRIWKRKAGRGL